MSLKSSPGKKKKGQDEDSLREQEPGSAVSRPGGEKLQIKFTSHSSF